jgi:hypothetical protein
VWLEYRHFQVTNFQDSIEGIWKMTFDNNTPRIFKTGQMIQRGDPWKNLATTSKLRDFLGGP